MSYERWIQVPINSSFQNGDQLLVGLAALLSEAIKYVDSSCKKKVPSYNVTWRGSRI